MEKLLNSLQEKLLPIASKISNQKFLIALRNSFIGTMPVIMAGSIAILLNAFLVDLPMEFGLTGITDSFQWLININDLIFRGSLAVVSLLFIFALGVNVAKIYDTDKLSSGLVAFSAFIISIGNSATAEFSLENLNLSEIFANVEGLTVEGDILTATVEGVIPGSYINASGYFTAILIGFLSSILFSKLMLKDWTIKLPETVPPAIAQPFLSIIPGLVSLYAVAGLSYVFNLITGELIIDWIYQILQTPLLGMSQNYFAVVFVAFLTQLFWFFGLHGGNVMAPIMSGVFEVAQFANMDAYQAGQDIPYLWTSGSYGSYVWYATLGLLIAIFWQSKNSHYRQVAKLGIGPVMFNIGEPVMYGLPTVLNPIMFIPFLLSPVVLTTVAYFATSLGWVAPVTQNITWVMPPVLYGFFSTAFDWRSIILSLINLALATLIYLPFVKMANKEEIKEIE
ncbi:MAG TPA: PTS transporter subunit EIIC [Pseudogracilibacillus sp.]|nr:PTS transporter subunit EIIC [Pseudogracilibacillus sp.]